MLKENIFKAQQHTKAFEIILLGAFITIIYALDILQLCTFIFAGFFSDTSFFLICKISIMFLKLPALFLVCFQELSNCNLSLLSSMSKPLMYAIGYHGLKLGDVVTLDPISLLCSYSLLFTLLVSPTYVVLLLQKLSGRCT